ncbi:amidohydrolase family protein [Pseudoflavonifractor sp. HCP28S3_F10]|uniref:amidohydrolase family protein n=1 Tax=Pseudoflavonifractor sp. HCP28S3_F10 TaxID=3438947 RepID=UPI003F8A0964
MDTCEVLIRNANVFDVGKGLDIAVRDGKIVQIGPDLPMTAPTELRADNKLVVPGLVESHTHLDKSFTAVDEDTPTLQEAYGIFARYLAKIPPEGMVEDIKARSRRVLDWELASGASAVKSHVLVCPQWGMGSLQAINELKEEYRGRLDLYNITQWTPEYDREFRAAAKAGEIDFIAGYPLFTDDPMGNIDQVFALAEEYGLPLDLHIDERDEPDISCFLSVIEHTRRYHMEGRVTCGHVTALCAVEDEPAHRAICEAVEAGINIITLPSCNMFLMGRKDRQPIRRGVTRVDEFLKAGANVAVASDNVRDPYRPFGNGDLLEEALFAAQVLQYGTADQLDEVMRMITTRPARNTMIPDYGLAQGCRADLVILDAPTAKEAIISQSERLYVLKGGRIVVKDGRIL